MDSDVSKTKIDEELRSIRIKKIIESLEVNPPKSIERSGAVAQELSLDTKAVSQEQKKSVLIRKEEESEIILRRMLAAECSWKDMKPYAWDIFEKWPTGEIGAKLIELSYLHGTVSEVVAVLTEIKNRNPTSYFGVSIDVRPYLVLKLWQQGKERVLNDFLHRKSFQGQLLRIEKLFVFWSLYGCADRTRAWIFLRKYQDEIVTAIKEYGAQIKLQLSLFYLEAGKLAIAVGKQDRAKIYLEKVPLQAKEFKEALDLLVQFKVDVDENGFCIFGRKLAREQNWRSRLSLFKTFFSTIDRSGGIKHQERNALNKLLKNPDKWFPESTEAWHQLSQMLIKFVEFEYLLPNLMSFFHQNQIKFHSPIFERAIWEPVFTMDCQDLKKKQYWIGVAKLHKYVGGQFKDDGLLWEAKDLIDLAEVGGGVPSALPWAKLHHALVLWMGRSLKIEESERVELLAKVKVVGHYLDVAEEEINAYIEAIKSPNFAVIDRLMKVIQKRDNQLSEIKLLRKKAGLSHYTNQNLKRFWEIAVAQKQNDLAWRIATVLYQRGVLKKEIEQVWALSGERRRDFAIRTIPAKLLFDVYSDWQGDEKIFAESILLVGFRIPEILAIVDKNVKPYKSRLDSTIDQRFEENLPKLPWLLQGRKIYCDHPEQAIAGRPPFAQVVPDTNWVRVMLNISDRLGVNCWRWQLSRLADSLDGVIPQLLKHKDNHGMTKVGRWLRTLSPLQRKAWYNLMAITERMDNEDGYRVLGRLICRLSVVVYQNHNEALEGLSKMECPLLYKWDLESFIISESYSNLRHHMVTYSNFDVPERLPFA